MEKTNRRDDPFEQQGGITKGQPDISYELVADMLAMTMFVSAAMFMQNTSSPMTVTPATAGSRAPAPVGLPVRTSYGPLHHMTGNMSGANAVAMARAGVCCG